MELAFLTPLLKDGANCISGGVAINNKRVVEAGLTKDWGRANSIDEGLEGRFMFVFPMKAAPFCAVSDESIEWSGQHAEVADIHVIKVEKAQKCT